MTYRRRIRITRDRKVVSLRGRGHRVVSVSRSASPKHPKRPGHGWFAWSWGTNNGRRVRTNLPAKWPWDRAFWRR